MLKSIFGRLRSRLNGGTLRIAVALCLVVGASALFWASRDYTVVAPDWDGQVRGVTYYPSHTFSDSQLKHVPAERIDSDMAQLSRITGHVRTYTVSGGLDKVPEIARRYGLTVSLGIWIGADLDLNEKEIDTALKVILSNRRVIDRVIVGNEAIMRGDVTSDQLNAYIKRVRDALPARIKVTTAETWSTWLLHPELGENVDVVFVHLLPYWEGTDVRGSLTFLQHAYNDVQEEFPDKPIVIGEVGWPSEGRTHERRRGFACQRGLFHPQLCPARDGQGLRLLHHRSLRSALEGRQRRMPSAPIGACSTPMAIRNFPLPACCARSPNGEPSPCSPRSSHCCSVC